MTSAVTQIDEVRDRVRLPFVFEAERLLAEIQAMGLNDFTYYDVLPLRSPAHLVDPSVPVPPPAEDYADGTWCDWRNTSMLDNAPYL